MRYGIIRHPDTRDLEIRITITDYDMCLVPLDGVDKALIRECDKSVKLSDKLLGLHTLALRLEQKSEANHEPS